MTIRVVIADDHAVIRDGLKNILETEPDIQVVALARNGEEAVREVERHRPDVAVVDIRMPGMDGIKVTRCIAQVCPRTAVIVLTMYDQDEYLFQAVTAGAKGYILKDVPSAEVIHAVRAGARGESLLHPAVAAKLMQGFASMTKRNASDGGSPALSDREMEVLRLLGMGLTNKNIALRLYITERTVKKHTGSILDKLKARTRTEAVMLAAQRGLISFD